MAGIPAFNLAGTAVASTTTNTIAWPTHATNHIGLLIIQTDAEASSLVTAAGFVEVSGSPQTTGTAAATNAVALQVYWKRATGTAEANVTLADAGGHTFAQIITFTNVATSGNPWDIAVGGVKSSATTNLSITGTTTTTADCLIVGIAAGTVDSATVQASAWTDANLANPSTAEITDVATATGGGGQLYAAQGGLKLKGATGNIVATLASATKNAFLLIALKPIEPTGTGSVAVAKPALSGSGTTTYPFAQARAGIIAGLDSAQSEAAGWDAVVKAGLLPGAVVRTSDTVVTITVSAFASYDITAQETITATIPASALQSGVQLVATPTFTIDTAASGITGTGSVAVPNPGLSGTGIRGNLGTGSVAIATPTLAGTGIRGNLGTGSVAVPTPALAGTGIRGNVGTGSVAVATPGLSGTGTQALIATGSIAVATPGLSGVGLRGNLGTGSVAIPMPGLSGTGTSGTSVTGSGSVALAAVTLAGDGTVTAPTPAVETTSPGGGASGPRTAPWPHRGKTRFRDGKPVRDAEPPTTHAEVAVQVVPPAPTPVVVPPLPALRSFAIEAPPAPLEIQEPKRTLTTDTTWRRYQEEEDAIDREEEEAFIVALMHHV